MDELGVLLRRRVRRSVAEKRLIVEQTLESGAIVARVAQAHGVNPNVVFHWRREYRGGKLAEPGLVPVLVTCEQPESDTSLSGRPLEASPATIRVDLSGGVVVSIEGSAIPRWSKRLFGVFGRDRYAARLAGSRRAGADGVYSATLPARQTSVIPLPSTARNRIVTRGQSH
jgi:transposase